MEKGGRANIMTDRYRGTLYVEVTADLTARVLQPPVAAARKMHDDRNVSKKLLPLVLIICGAAAPAGKPPACSGPDHYAASVAFGALKNAVKLTSDNVDFSHVKSIAIVSQRIGKDLWRQVFRVTYPLKTGHRVEAIVVSDASSEECSMSSPQIFIVKETL